MTSTIYRASPEAQRAVMLLGLEATVRRDSRWTLTVEDDTHRLVREEGRLTGKVWPEDMSRTGCPRMYAVLDGGLLVDSGTGEASAVFSRINRRLDLLVPE